MSITALWKRDRYGELPLVTQILILVISITVFTLPLEYLILEVFDYGVKIPAILVQLGWLPAGPVGGWF